MADKSEINKSSRGQKVRQTLQPKGSESNDVEGRPRSHSHVQRTIILQPPIQEEDSDGTITQNGNRMSFTKKPPSRSNSVTRVKSKIAAEIKGYDNGAFDGATVELGLDRAYSTRSSAHGSVQSLQVQREQYCCCSRWSQFERRLAASVGILAGVIVALVITVGILARETKMDKHFTWIP